MISTSGSKLIEDETIEVIVKELFHRVTLITPNIDEAAFLSGMQIRNEEEMEIAAKKLLVSGCRAVLMKGGHLEGKEKWPIFCLHTMKLRSDWLCRPFRLKIHTVQVAHSSAIAAYMALGKELPDAVRAAKDYITAALHAGANVETGHGHGPLNHFSIRFPS